MNAKNYDLSAQNPSRKGDIKHKSPEQMLKSIKEKETKIKLTMDDIAKII